MVIDFVFKSIPACNPNFTIMKTYRICNQNWIIAIYFQSVSNNKPSKKFQFSQGVDG